MVVAYNSFLVSITANATVVERRDLINELKIMVTVGEHPNIVSLIGACTRGGWYYGMENIPSG